MNSTVDLSFRYLQSDYARALRAHFASRMRLPLDIVVTIVLAVAGIYFWSSPGDHWLGVVCAAVSAALTLVLVAAFLVIPPLVFRSNPKFRDDYSLTFSQEGIHFRTAHIDSKLQWSLYSRTVVDAYSYVLYYGSRDFTVIPKRVFQSAEQQQAFEQLLTQHVPETVRRVK